MAYGPRSSGGGSSSWGSITGTLSAQTDLQTALDDLSPRVRVVEGAYDATAQDFNTIFTDAGMSGWAMIRLPAFEDALATGGVVRVRATRDYVDGNSQISVYLSLADGGGSRFLIGATHNTGSPLYSLYSTGVGDYLELAAVTIAGTNYWQVLNFIGFWEDRD